MLHAKQSSAEVNAPGLCRYAIITPARNEEDYVDSLVRSVQAQLTSPTVWIVVVNGSTDSTLQRFENRKSRIPYLRVITVDVGDKRSFASKAIAVNHAYRQMPTPLPHFIGILDADISLPADYYTQLLVRFSKQPSLGLAAGLHVEELVDRKQVVQRQPPGVAVCGAQVFRRECFEQIGGMRPLRWGGVDTLAGVMARANGWTTRSFDEVAYLHRRTMGSASDSNRLVTRFRYGVRDRMLGMPVLYALAKCIRRFSEAPKVLGALAWSAGFASGCFMCADPEIPAACRAALRREQLERLFGRARLAIGRNPQSATPVRSDPR